MILLLTNASCYGNSVRLSVRPSAKRVLRDKTKHSFAKISTPLRNKNLSSLFLTPTAVAGVGRLPHEIVAETDLPPSKRQVFYMQGSYRILTVVFQTFRGQNYFFFQTFRGTLFIFTWTKNITKLAFKRWNFLYNVFFYSKYRMGLKFLNSELQMHR